MRLKIILGSDSYVTFILVEFFSAVNVASQKTLRTPQWKNLDDFISGGWYPTYPDNYGDSAGFKNASDVGLILAPLDKNSTLGIWSGTRNVT